MDRPERPGSSAASQMPARALHALSCFSSSLSAPISEFLLAEIERANALQPVRRLEDFAMIETVDGVAISGEPVLFHRAPGELVVLGAALVFLCAIDQVNDVAHLVIRLGGQHGPARLSQLSSIVFSIRC